jgi:hypothetical protein
MEARLQKRERGESCLVQRVLHDLALLFRYGYGDFKYGSQSI